jgi:hypothetical protein
MTDKQTIIFLHIPKTGGITFNLIAKQQYKPDEMIAFKSGPTHFNFTQEQKQKAKYIQGHVGFGFHDVYSIDGTYITILRNPIDRVISNYYFIKQNEKHFLHQELTSKNYSLEKFITSGIALEADNCHVRYLSGKIDAPYGKCTPEMLEAAKSNLIKSFSVFGIQEYYNEFLLLMREIHGWKIPFYKRYNKTKRRANIKDLDSKTLEVITSLNSLDIELYNFAKIEFEKKIKLRGIDFQKKLKKFNAQTHFYQTLSKIKNKLFFN